WLVFPVGISAPKTFVALDEEIVPQPTPLPPDEDFWVNPRPIPLAAAVVPFFFEEACPPPFFEDEPYHPDRGFRVRTLELIAPSVDADFATLQDDDHAVFWLPFPVVGFPTPQAMRPAWIIGSGEDVPTLTVPPLLVEFEQWQNWQAFAIQWPPLPI